MNKKQTERGEKNHHANIHAAGRCGASFEPFLYRLRQKNLGIYRYEVVRVLKQLKKVKEIDS